MTITGIAAAPPAAVPAGRPASVLADAGLQGRLAIPDGSSIVSVGREGMLTKSASDSGFTYRWTRLADGDTKVLADGVYWGADGTDVVASQAGSVYTLVDMSGDTEPVVIDTAGIGGTGASSSLRRVVGTRLFLSTHLNGVREYHLVSLEGDRRVDRKVVLPQGAEFRTDHSSGSDDLAVVYHTVADGFDRRHIGVIDLASGLVRTTDSVAPGAISFSLSPTHVAWFEAPASRTLTVVIASRAGAEVGRVTLDSPTGTHDFTVRAIGAWLSYARTRGSTATWSDPLHPLEARAGNRETVKLLDHVVSSTYGPDGDLFVLGGTVEHGEGLYRIAPDAVGRPAASLAIGSGRPTALAVVSATSLPGGVVDFDRSGGTMKASWTLSRFNATVSLRVTHTASGRSGGAVSPRPRDGVLVFPLVWDGLFDNGGPAYNGAYSWTMTAKPANGIGPDVVRTGAFTLTRAPRQHDFNDNGSPDLLARDGAGRLGSYDLRQIQNATTRNLDPLDLGAGWYGYDRVTATGNIAGAPAADLVARDRSGILWLLAGTGRGLAPRSRIGGGWQIYDKISGGSDLTGDGLPDLVAADKSGILWLYPATARAESPFAPRKRVGGGWGIYSRIIATGNIAGASAGDLVARDKDGFLWLYLGRGDGSFAPRIRIGGGWNAYTSLVGVGDFDGDGRNDLVAAHENPSLGLYLYKGTSNWKAPFNTRSAVYHRSLGEGIVELF
ncbi:FG-GAP-like repeat-containing protein [Streptomyces roseolus]|uniref:FG-GAP-like repeat-containing protein n=1 Tax=Streptomyces roseolus TaxID=67358 RepID=UPI00379CC4C4